MKLSPVRALAVTCLLAATISSLPAQDWARQQLEKLPRHREWASIKYDGRTVEAFVAYPETKDKAPVVLVIHAIFGMSDWVQEVADEFAAAGYLAVVPDLLSGSEVTKAVNGLDPDRVTANLNATADYALKLPAATQTLYVAGFCWGGGQTFRIATNRPGVAAAFVFYGPPPAKDAMARITAPVYGFFAENDARIGAMIPGAITDMKAAGKRFEPVSYDGAGHGFMRAVEAPDASEANKKARQESWDRLKQLMRPKGNAALTLPEAVPGAAKPRERARAATASCCE